MPASTAPATVRLHGWSITTAVPVIAAPSDGPPDIIMRLETTEVLDGSRLVGESVLDQRPTWDSRLVRVPDGFRYRVDDDYEVSISPAVDDLTIRFGRGRRLESLALVFTGGVVAIASTLRGRSCLHASSVAIDGRAVAIIGPVGAGKTTTAGLLVAAGAALIGDDVLAPVVSNGALVAPRGPLELRFRESARALALSIPASAVRTTVDGRTGIVPVNIAMHDCTPLSCFLLPRLVDGPAGVTVREVSRTEAFGHLTASPRLEGWRDGAIVEQEFDLAARLANGVPMFEVTIAGLDSLSLVSADRLRAAIEPCLGSGISSARAS
jgi:hypothetical protein